MTFSTLHLDGSGEQDPPLEALARLVRELDEADAEHTDVSVMHESMWSLSAYKNGLVVWENVEEDDPRPQHMKGVPRDEVLRLFHLLAGGHLAAIHALPWQEGYG